MLVRLSLLLVLLIPARAALAADTPWSGSWDSRWREGGARLELTQTGDRVVGEYRLYGGRIEATANGRTLTGRWIEGERSGAFEFILSPDGQSFAGRFESGEWWTGQKTNAPPFAARIDQTSPRQTLRSFVDAGRFARVGSPEALGAAAAVLDFSADSAVTLPGDRLQAASDLFALIDETTFRVWTMPGPETTGDSAELHLAQLGTGVVLPITLKRHPDGRWWIVMPTPDAVAKLRQALFARADGKPPAADGYKLLHTPRATMRSFIEGMNTWDRGGRDLALSTLDLSQLPEATRDYTGPLVADYLKRIVDAIGLIEYQSVPDDKSDRDTFVFFQHPAGRIAVAPVGHGADTVWKFTPDTVTTAADLYVAVEDLPQLAGFPRQPDTPFFAMRRTVREIAPALTRRVGAVELWQAIGVVLLPLTLLALSVLVVFAALQMLRGFVGQANLHRDRGLVWPLRIALTCYFSALLSPILGLPPQVKDVQIPANGALLAASLTVLGWRLVGVFGYRFEARAQAAASPIDEITVSLITVILRATIVVLGLLQIAAVLSIPTSGIIAGLGISGLAIAFASRETLSNVFGAAILVADRPFRRGDWIVAGDVQGTVEHVGVRSTRVRSVEDSVIVVPNGKLTDATINNWGTRRVRLARAKLLVGYGATPEQLDALVAGLRALVAETEGFLPDRTQVGVVDLSESGLVIDLTSYVSARTYGEERAAKNALMIAIVSLAERIGIRLGPAAEPTPAVVPKGAAPPPDAAAARHPAAQERRAAV